MKNKNIHLKPTIKSSNLYAINNKLYFEKYPDKTVNAGNQNIYITNDEEIKKGDWCYDTLRKIVSKCIEISTKSIKENDYLVFDGNMGNPRDTYKKIILTTDQDLINDGVQEISEEFLEWFVQNPSCESVEIEEIEKYKSTTYDQPDKFIGYDYKIIIPSEEPKQGNFYDDLLKYFETTPREKVLEDWNKSAHLDNVGPTVDEFLENTNKQQETPEEAAKSKFPHKPLVKVEITNKKREAFIEGANWMQERTYSEEELKSAFKIGFNIGYGSPVQELDLKNEHCEKWFKKFKNK